jgi:hypothetical protein
VYLAGFDCPRSQGLIASIHDDDVIGLARRAEHARTIVSVSIAPTDDPMKAAVTEGSGMHPVNHE